MDPDKALTYEQSIQTNKAVAAVEQDILTYFDVLGYTLQSRKPSLHFERGSFIFDQVDMDPRKRQSRLLIDLIRVGDEQTLVEMSLFVQKPLLPILEAEHEFWQAELDGLAMTIHYEFIDSERLRFAAERVKWQRLALLTLMAMLGFFFSSLLLSAWLLF